MKSIGEKVIADWLFEHDLKFVYEFNHRWDDHNYKPDFTIFLDAATRKQTRKKKVVIEFFGMKGDHYYDLLSAEKRQYWSTQKDTIFLEYCPDDCGATGATKLRELLRDDLSRHQVPYQRLSEDEIRNRCSETLAIAALPVSLLSHLPQQIFPPQIFTGRDIFHFRCNDP